MRLFTQFAAAVALVPLTLFCHTTQAESATALDGVNHQASKKIDPRLTTYVDIAHATFEDSLLTAQTLATKIQQLLQAPSKQTLAAAQQAWRDARVPYLQSEVFRFGNPIVDSWEGQVNTWPLDEGLIDYVSQSYEHELGNVGANLNIIASPELHIGGTTLDASQLTPELLASLNELGGSEANVATGYHAIEFLLWGQDTNGTEPGAGHRPYTDFATGSDCTQGHCARRGEYLKAATDLLIEDLKTMVAAWSPDNPNNYRAQFLQLPTQEALTRMLFGMGSLALGELSGERIKVALVANSPEDEQDCFSDNTHYSHFYDALGIENIYFGRYTRVDGSQIKGPALAGSIAALDQALATRLRQAFEQTHARMQALVDTAERPEHPEKFDQLIAEGNTQGAALLRSIIDSLVAQTRLIEEAAKALGIDNLRPSQS